MNQTDAALPSAAPAVAPVVISKLEVEIAELKARQGALAALVETVRSRWDVLGVAAAIAGAKLLLEFADSLPEDTPEIPMPLLAESLEMMTGTGDPAAYKRERMTLDAGYAEFMDVAVFYAASQKFQSAEWDFIRRHIAAIARARRIAVRLARGEVPGTDFRKRAAHLARAA